MVFLASLIIPLLALWLWWPVAGLSRGARALAALATALLGCSPALLLQWLQSGRIDYTTIAYLQVPSGWLLATLGALLPYMVLRDLGWALARLAGSATWARRLHGRRLALLALLAALVVTGYGTWAGLQPPQVRERTIVLPRLPAQLDGLRVAVLADLHASPVNDARYLETVVERSNGARPDLVLLPGDMVDGEVAATGPQLEPLARLQAPHGVWLAPGNHEYYSGYDAWMAEFARRGLSVLQNQTRVLDIGGARLALSGIGDPVHGRTSTHNTDPSVPEGVPPDVQAVARQAAAAGAQFHILMAHQPRFARDNAAHGIDLQISGHTHGGHIRGMDQWLVAAFNGGFVRGLYDVGPMRLFVTSGAGLWAGFPVRLGVPPHIDILRLQRAPSPSAPRTP